MSFLYGKVVKSQRPALQSTEAGAEGPKTPNAQRDPQSKGAQEGTTQEICPHTKGRGKTTQRKPPCRCNAEAPRSCRDEPVCSTGSQSPRGVISHGPRGPEAPVVSHHPTGAPTRRRGSEDPAPLWSAGALSRDYRMTQCPKGSPEQRRPGGDSPGNPPPHQGKRENVPEAMPKPPGAAGMSPRALPAASHPEVESAMGPGDPRPQWRPTLFREPQPDPGWPGLAAGNNPAPHSGIQPQTPSTTNVPAGQSTSHQMGAGLGKWAPHLAET
ncbi:PREDICTED: proline-rich protein HaeIII subfamily 1-like [Cyprinodon variegatus]|uniref:proline-rich protein HaeIII subfamily 1-like n=1 Tax=Cyprinodon variegatus TaxID=28743 RepID=UPI000742C87D|nr:PREDICTED: proline-rich protein HaeIII subfamily 1-like [Cyprinodon variegatus]